MSRHAEISWRPNPGPQTQFLASTAYEVLYGGAAGGGKSDALLMSPLRYVDHPAFHALILRRTYPELQRSLIEKSRRWYPLVGGSYNESRKQWRFPSGALIEFGHLEGESDAYAYASAEFSYIAFDELTSFLERHYVFLLSRARSAAGLPIMIRSATNPGGIGHEWVFRRWQPWLDQGEHGLRAAPGQVLFYENTDDGERWTSAHGSNALSRAFIPARVSDNPHLMQGDPGYLARLGGLDPVTRRWLRDGDWLAKPLAGNVFKRSWFETFDEAPRHVPERVRYWDRASTAGGGDWTVGLLLGRHEQGFFLVLDIVRFRGSPGEVEATIIGTAHADGIDTIIGIEQDPGSAGAFEAHHYVKQLAGFRVKTARVTGDKLTRALPVSAHSEHGQVKLVRARWNFALLDELEGFPDGGHDDQVDALSGAFNLLTSTAKAQAEVGYVDFRRGVVRVRSC